MQRKRKERGAVGWGEQEWLYLLMALENLNSVCWVGVAQALLWTPSPVHDLCEGWGFALEGMRVSLWFCQLQLWVLWEWGRELLTLLCQTLQDKRGDLSIIFFCDCWVTDASEIPNGFKLCPYFRRNCMRDFILQRRIQVSDFTNERGWGGNQTASVATGCRNEESPRALLHL